MLEKRTKYIYFAMEKRPRLPKKGYIATNYIHC